MPAILAASLIFAQAASAAAPATLEDDRLAACLEEARADPAQAIITANEWMEGLSGPATSHPLQCLGFAYMGLLRWEAARDAFYDARDALDGARNARDIDVMRQRARLGAMAGNAAIAAEDNFLALPLLQAARTDAIGAGDNRLAATILADIARVQVLEGHDAEAATALQEARALGPQNAEIWLLSATLARRTEDLPAAQDWIETAARLAPRNPAIGLEAGVIAAMGGHMEAARDSWLSVIEIAGGSPQAQTARSYLEQIGEEMPDR